MDAGLIDLRLFHHTSATQDVPIPPIKLKATVRAIRMIPTIRKTLPPGERGEFIAELLSTRGRPLTVARGSSSTAFRSDNYVAAATMAIDANM